MSARHLLFGRQAFTLLELLVVLAILSLLSVMAVTRLGGVYQSAQLQTAISGLGALDGQARSFAASRHLSVELRIDLNKGQVSYHRDGLIAAQPFRLPSSVMLERVISIRERKTSGVAQIRLGPLGTGESYAVKLGTGHREGEWLLFTGGAGQMTPIDSTREVEEVFRVLKSQSPDAP